MKTFTARLQEQRSKKRTNLKSRDTSLSGFAAVVVFPAIRDSRRRRRQPRIARGERMRALLKFSSVAVLILLVIMALGPENWQPRSGLRWEFDHFAGYFAITIFVCLAWPRSLLVGAAIMAFGSLLEFLQAYTTRMKSSAIRAAANAAPAPYNAAIGLEEGSGVQRLD